jgi:hypothetical protein
VTLEELEAGFAARLAGQGFTLQAADRQGPMGSGRVRYSSGRCDLSFDSDRGVLAVTMGPPGGTTYGYRPWADLLGVPVEPDLDATAQAAFLLGHAPRIEALIAADPKINDRLRTANWRYVKEFLGLDPSTPRPGTPPS